VPIRETGLAPVMMLHNQRRYFFAIKFISRIISYEIRLACLIQKVVQPSNNVISLRFFRRNIRRRDNDETTFGKVADGE
jgi:hypothetical protein